MSDQAALLAAFESHSPDAIRTLLASGLSPTDPIDGKRPIDHLVEMYLRSPRFAACLQVLLDAGATLDDPLLQALLLDDDSSLRKLLTRSTDSVNKKMSLLCAFTSCRGVSPLHICAEFNSIRCARLLLDQGADVNSKADLAADGIGGHTPIFHTVNSLFNHARPMMEILADAGASLDIRVDAVLWGESMTWETVVYDVAPISYAQCGLYRQFHRREEDIYSNIEYLYSHRNNNPLAIRNVPNKYLIVGR